MIVEIFSAKAGTGHATVHLMFKEDDAPRVVKEEYHLVIPDGHHCHTAVDILGN